MSAEFPILSLIPSIRAALTSSNTVILQAPPGAGKSTVLPLHLLDLPVLKKGKILMLEPRRLAAKTVATRLAQQLNEDTGETVGFRIRFEKRISERTQLEILTEGILTRMISQDQALENISLLIFDEFHERSIHSDLALALALEIQSVLRPDLRILIMSATLDTAYLAQQLPMAPIIKSEGRQHPIHYKYFKEDERSPIAVQTAHLIRIALDKEEGDILAFLPGAGEIRKVKDLLEENTYGVHIVPLYGDLGWKEQQEAILPDPAGLRRVVLATSIAETSITIEGIKVVVDCGYSRLARFDPSSGLTKLVTVKVSRDTADQRAGRAGRLGPGLAYRLWEEGKHQYLNATRKPEILETDLSPLVLELANWGRQSVLSYPWVTTPPEAGIKQARELLTDLGALKNGEITHEGKEMSQFPTHPRISRMLLEGKKIGLSGLACDIAALIEERNPAGKEEGVNLVLGLDLLGKKRNKERTNVDRFLLDRIERTASEWRRRTQSSVVETFSDTDAGHLLSFAYPDRIAKKISGARYRLANGRTAKLEEHDPLTHEEWIVAAHLDGGSGEARIFLAAPLDDDDVLHRATEKDVMMYDEQQNELLVRTEKRIGGILLESKPLKNIPRTEFENLLCEVIQKKGLNLFSSDKETDELSNRLSCIHRWDPDHWPDLSVARLLHDCNTLIKPFLTPVNRISDLKKISLETILLSVLSWEKQQELNKLLPITLKVPSGSDIRIEYSPDGNPPVLSVRLQELFGLLETPTVMNGKIKLLIHLLSPGYKPVQVTQDLHSFWKTTYQEVRKELRMRYPRHSWPEDPFTAQAVRGVKKRNSGQ